MASVSVTHLPNREPTGSIAGSVNDSAPAQVTAVVFDLGNVLIAWDPLPAIAKAVGAEQAARFLADEDFDFTAWNRQQDAGRSWLEGEAVAVASHPHWELAIRGYRENFSDSIVGAIEDTVQVLRELYASGIQLFALTNWSKELFPVALNRFDFLGLFEDIIVSGEEGVAKPDPRIFEILHERIGLSLGDCILIDDSPSNIKAAAEAGLDAILFTATGHLRGDLALRGLPMLPP
ncbi:MAG: HAD family phosphatase [Dermatophilaceae bacterium]